MPLFDSDHFQLPNGWEYLEDENIPVVQHPSVTHLTVPSTEWYAHPTQGWVKLTAEPNLKTWFMRAWQNPAHFDTVAPDSASTLGDMQLRVPQLFYAWEALHGFAQAAEGDDTRLESITHDLTRMGDIRLCEPIALSKHTSTGMLVSFVDSELAQRVAERDDLAQRLEVVEAVLYTGSYEARQTLVENTACPRWARTLALTMLTSA